MKKFELLLAFTLLSFLVLISVAHAQYWFQSGARASGNSDHNSGGSVEIQTVTPQKLINGSMAFWVGETLSNGAFLQIGYSISNQTGNLTTDCTTTGCSNSTFVKAGDAEWFYEYFEPGNNSTFFGTTGPDASAGVNGTFNTYSFYSLGNTWYFLFNNKTIGSVNLGTSDSGIYTPIAVGEMANTSNAKTYMRPVVFSNLSAYKYDMFLPVQTAYGTINYGVGSETNIPNPYGVQEIDSRTNYFKVGSGLPMSTNNTKLWSLGYRLTVNSQYGNISSKTSYIAYTIQTISAPSVVNLNSTTREVFTGWTGSGLGFYTGSQNTVQLLMTANITETANWQRQYLVNVSSPYGFTNGTGWYANGSIASYSVSNSTFLRNGAQEFRLSGWSTGTTGMSNSSRVTGPVNITALWQYRSELLGVNSGKKRINVTEFMVNGKQVNDTPFLNASATSAISGAYYKGVWLTANTDVSQNSPELVLVPLPVYNVTIKTTDVFGFPVNASVTLVFTNGTGMSTHSGPGGVLTIPNVPFGYADTTASYFITKSNALASGGITANLVMVSQLNVVEFIVLVIVFVYVFEKNRRGHIKNQYYETEAEVPQKKPVKQRKNVWSP